MINFIRIYLFSHGLLCFISYSEHLSVIYNNKNYGSFPYIIFIAVQNSRITLDRPQCIAMCLKFQMGSVLLKNLIIKYISTFKNEQNFKILYALIYRWRFKIIYIYSVRKLCNASRIIIANNP